MMACFLDSTSDSEIKEAPVELDEFEDVSENQLDLFLELVDANVGVGRFADASPCRCCSRI